MLVRTPDWFFAALNISFRPPHTTEVYSPEGSRESQPSLDAVSASEFSSKARPAPRMRPPIPAALVPFASYASLAVWTSSRTSSQVCLARISKPFVAEFGDAWTNLPSTCLKSTVLLWISASRLASNMLARQTGGRQVLRRLAPSYIIHNRPRLLLLLKPITANCRCAPEGRIDVRQLFLSESADITVIP